MKNKKAFTLLELMIVITIVWIVSIMVYAPYNYFQKKAELKIWAKTVAKTLSEARNNAIFWVSSGSTNQSVWVYFEKQKNNIKIYNYPYSFWTWSQIDLWDDYLKQEIDIWKNIVFDKIEDKKKVLFLFSAISGNLNIFEFDSWNKIDLVDQNWDNIIDINISYKQANTPALQKTIKYYTKTYISDF